MKLQTSNDGTWVEPDSENENSRYPFNKIYESESGHSVEFDDTPEYERIRIQHRIGNYTEIQSDGQEVHKIIGDSYEIVVKNQYVKIKGNCIVTIEGNSSLHVKGDAWTQVDGDYNIKAKGDFNLIADGDVTIASSKNDLNLNVGGELNQVNIGAPGGINASGSLNVEGFIASEEGIQSDGPITTKKKFFALEGIATSGGLVIGGTDGVGPLPAGVIVATTSVFAPQVSDAEGSLQILRNNTRIHSHTGNLGAPTSPPTTTI